MLGNLDDLRFIGDLLLIVVYLQLVSDLDREVSTAFRIFSIRCHVSPHARPGTTFGRTATATSRRTLSAIFLILFRVRRIRFLALPATLFTFRRCLRRGSRLRSLALLLHRLLLLLLTPASFLATLFLLLFAFLFLLLKLVHQGFDLPRSSAGHFALSSRRCRCGLFCRRRRRRRSFRRTRFTSGLVYGTAGRSFLRRSRRRRRLRRRRFVLFRSFRGLNRTGPNQAASL